MIGAEGPEGGPGWYKKAGYVTHGEQASPHLPSTVFAAVPASMFLPWLPLKMNCDL